MKRHEKAIRGTGILVTVAVAVVVVIGVLTRPVIAPPPPNDIVTEREDVRETPVPAFNQPFPGQAHAAFTSATLLTMIEEIEALVAALGFQPPERPLHDELARSGLNPEAPGTLYLNLEPLEDAPVRFLLLAEVADSVALEAWLYEEATIAPAPPPVTESHSGVTIQTGLPHGAAWADLGGHAAFGNDADLLRGFVEAWAEAAGERTGQRRQGQEIAGVFRVQPVARRLAAWPLWTPLAGLALDPMWSDAERVGDMEVPFVIQRRGTTWRFHGARASTAVDEPFGFTLPAQETTLSMGIAGTPPQRAALDGVVQSLAAASRDPLTQQTVDVLLSSAIGSWYVNIHDTPDLDWRAAIRPADPEAALTAITALTAARPSDDTTARCSPAGVCFDRDGSWIHLGPTPPSDTGVIDARSIVEPVITRIRASAPMLRRVTQWTNRLGLSDPAWNHLLARIGAIHSDVRRTEDAVTTTVDVYFAEPAP